MDMIVNNNWITLSYDEWVEKYKPHLRENDETYIKYYNYIFYIILNLKSQY